MKDICITFIVVFNCNFIVQSNTHCLLIKCLDLKCLKSRGGGGGALLLHYALNSQGGDMQLKEVLSVENYLLVLKREKERVFRYQTLI